MEGSLPYLLLSLPAVPTCPASPAFPAVLALPALPSFPVLPVFSSSLSVQDLHCIAIIRFFSSVFCQVLFEYGVHA